jgi:hypothetical protein
MPDVKRVLILAPTAAQALRFVEPAGKLALELVLACADDSGSLRLDFDTRDSALQVVELASRSPIAAIVAIGDAAVPVAARAASMLGLCFHTPKAADACRNKSALRVRLEALGLNVAKPATANVQAALETRNLKLDASALSLICLMTAGRLRVLAVSDSVQPPRRLTALDHGKQRAVISLLQAIVRALGLKHGPVAVEMEAHAQRIAVADVSAAYIPGDANHLLSFRIPLVDEHISWEELLLRNALGLDTSRVYLG